MKQKSKRKLPNTWKEYQYCKSCCKDTLHSCRERGQYEEFVCLICGNQHAIRVR